MATYAPRPDGLLEVTLDDGRRMPTALDASTLEAQGIYAQMAEPPPSPLASQGTAGLGNLGTPAQAPGLSDLGTSPAFGQLMGAGAAPPQPPPAPIGPPVPPPPPAGNMSVMPEAGMSRMPPPAPPAPAAQGAPVAPGRGALEQDISDTAQKFMLAELERGAAPAQRIPGGEKRDTYELKYKVAPPVDPQIAEDIGESRIDQQLATQETSEQEQYGRAMQARLAAREASQAQRELERSIVRKNTIEREVGQRIEAIDARIAKARAVTESGSARERVMKDKGWFGRILATIGVAMGAMAAGQTGGRNLVQEQLDKEVSEELEREKQLYNVDPERSALKDIVDAWGTPQGAQKEYELHLREAALTKMQAWARQADEQSVPVAFRQWLADQALLLQQARAAVNDDATTEVVEKWKNVPDKYVGGGGADPLKAAERSSKLADALRNIHGLGRKGEDTAAMLRIEETRAGRSLRTPSGQKLYAPDEKRAQTAEMQLFSVSQIRDNLNEIKRIMSKPYSEVNLADRERVNVLVQSTVTLGKEAEKLGALSGPDMALITPLSGELAKLRLNPLNPDVKIRAGIDQADKHFTRRALDAERGLYADPELTQPYRPSRPASFREVP